jgi:hypothetical protein
MRDHLMRGIAEPFGGTPIEIDYSAKAIAALGLIYLNATYGDCLPAGAQHTAGVWTGNATGTPVIFTDAQTESNYTGMSGGEFNPNDPATDQGCDPETALQYLQSTGLLASDGRHKIAGWLGIDATNPVEIRAAVWLEFGPGLALELPDEWVNPTPSESGFVWDIAGDPNPDNGHWICAVGCNETGLQVATWGMIGTITYAAIAKYCMPATGGNLYAFVSQDALVKAMAKFPDGFDWAQIVAKFDAAGGTVTA